MDFEDGIGSAVIVEDVVTDEDSLYEPDENSNTSVSVNCNF